MDASGGEARGDVRPGAEDGRRLCCGEAQDGLRLCRGEVVPSVKRRWPMVAGVSPPLSSTLSFYLCSQATKQQLYYTGLAYMRNQTAASYIARARFQLARLEI